MSAGRTTTAFGVATAPHWQMELQFIDGSHGRAQGSADVNPVARRVKYARHTLGAKLGNLLKPFAGQGLIHLAA